MQNSGDFSEVKVGALVPCYNGASTIAEVVKGVLTQLPEVIVVDDGSGDDSYNKAKSAGAQVLRHQKNQGKGAALRTGFEYIKQYKHWDAIIIMDADGQHDWNVIPRFIEAAQREEAGIILGNRMGGEAAVMPWLRWWTNKVTSRIISNITKQEIPDSQCGYRLIRTEVIKDIELTTSRFETESEILLNAASRGYSIYSVPIESIYKDERSHIHPMRDTFRFIKLVMSYYAGVFRN